MQLQISLDAFETPSKVLQMLLFAGAEISSPIELELGVDSVTSSSLTYAR